jgi:hypothetical protein
MVALRPPKAEVTGSNRVGCAIYFKGDTSGNAKKRLEASIFVQALLPRSPLCSHFSYHYRSN